MAPTSRLSSTNWAYKKAPVPRPRLLLQRLPPRSDGFRDIAQRRNVLDFQHLSIFPYGIIIITTLQPAPYPSQSQHPFLLSMALSPPGLQEKKEKAVINLEGTSHQHRLEDDLHAQPLNVTIVVEAERQSTPHKLQDHTKVISNKAKSPSFY